MASCVTRSYLDLFLLGHLGELFFLREQRQFAVELSGLLSFFLFDALEVQDFESRHSVDHVVAVVGVLGQPGLTDLRHGVVHQVQTLQVAAVAQVV